MSYEREVDERGRPDAGRTLAGGEDHSEDQRPRFMSRVAPGAAPGVALGVAPGVAPRTAGAAFVFLFSLAYYGFCLFPGLGGELNPGDSAKFQILGHTSILVHGPGYPLVLLLGAALRALALPLPPWWAMTFTLAVLPAACANAAAFLIAERLTRSLLFGFAAPLLLGSTGLMAVQATEAEVYPLALAFILVTTYLLVLFVETKRRSFFLAACAVYAMSFGNHLMMVMLVPIFLWLTITHRSLLLRPRPIALVLLFIVLGASQYLYLAYVAYSPETAYSEYMPLPPPPMELVHYIIGTYFSGLYGSGLDSIWTLEALIGTLESAHPWTSLPLVAVGLALFLSGWKRSPGHWYGLAVVYAAGLTFVPFALWYGAYDIQAFHLPVLGPLIVAAVATLGWWLGSRPRLQGIVGALLLVVGIGYAVQTALILSSRAPLFTGLEDAMGEIVARSPVEDPLVITTYELRMAILYYQLLGEVPASPKYHVRWRAIPELEDLPSVGGIVVPTDGHQFLRWVEHLRPDLRCRSETLELPEGVRWPAYAFECVRPEG